MRRDREQLQPLTRRRRRARSGRRRGEALADLLLGELLELERRGCDDGSARIDVMQEVNGRLRELGAYRGRPEPDLREVLDLVALGTVADMVPLSRENRILL